MSFIHKIVLGFTLYLSPNVLADVLDPSVHFEGKRFASPKSERNRNFSRPSALLHISGSQSGSFGTADDLLKVIIMKSFSDKQVNLEPKLCDYIIKNVERSYEKMIKFLKDVDELSLSSGKSININLIKKVINK